MPRSNELTVFSDAPIHAAIPRIQLLTGETKALVFRVFRYGGKGVTDLSEAESIKLLARPVMDPDPYPVLTADDAHELADWANGKVAVDVGPEDLTAAPSFLNVSLVRVIEDTSFVLISRAYIEVIPVEALLSA